MSLKDKILNRRPEYGDEDSFRLAEPDFRAEDYEENPAPKPSARDSPDMTAMLKTIHNEVVKLKDNFNTRLDEQGKVIEELENKVYNQKTYHQEEKPIVLKVHQDYQEDNEEPRETASPVKKQINQQEEVVEKKPARSGERALVEYVDGRRVEQKNIDKILREIGGSSSPTIYDEKVNEEALPEADITSLKKGLLKAIRVRRFIDAQLLAEELSRRIDSVVTNLHESLTERQIFLLERDEVLKTLQKENEELTAEGARRLTDITDLQGKLDVAEAENAKLKQLLAEKLVNQAIQTASTQQAAIVQRVAAVQPQAVQAQKVVIAPKAVPVTQEGSEEDPEEERVVETIVKPLISRPPKELPPLIVSTAGDALKDSNKLAYELYIKCKERMLVTPVKKEISPRTNTLKMTGIGRIVFSIAEQLSIADKETVETVKKILADEAYDEIEQDTQKKA